VPPATSIRVGLADLECPQIQFEETEEIRVFPVLIRAPATAARRDEAIWTGWLPRSAEVGQQRVIARFPFARGVIRRQNLHLLVKRHQRNHWGLLVVKSWS
jgi:hypothetical protein